MDVDLKILFKGKKCLITSPIYKGNLCYLEHFMSNLSNNYSKSLAGLIVFMEDHSDNGRDIFNTDQCHYVHKEEKIYEYIKGDLRVFWFEDEGKVVVCTHGVIKKSQKTRRNEINKAIRIKQSYFLNKKDRKIKYIED